MLLENRSFDDKLDLNSNLNFMKLKKIDNEDEIDFEHDVSLKQQESVSGVVNFNRPSTTKHEGDNKNIAGILKQLVLSGNWGRDEVLSDGDDALP